MNYPFGNNSVWQHLCKDIGPDNQVSCTVTFDPEKEGGMIPQVLNYFQYHLKGISLLPRHDYGAYPQMPYEAIDEKQYKDSMFFAI